MFINIIKTQGFSSGLLPCIFYKAIYFSFLFCDNWEYSLQHKLPITNSYLKIVSINFYSIFSIDAAIPIGSFTRRTDFAKIKQIAISLKF